ncbi:ATP-dependent DNA helicase [Rhodococcus sp. X156]|uniref:ATP-dependent helicase n=1 Tax=Rhodococcus sp. X156 TaxID=2499145 RepID=UPI000FDCC741|nr:ATP-dependent DNA helicase [Rhodococcus sp. X156]
MTSTLTRTPRIGPAELTAALGLPPPTDEQETVIAAPLGPALVVAGAGAGKTETMAARVVWLVANGILPPDQVLGLTFTRKAAQQLASRIRTRLHRLAGTDLLQRVDPSGELTARVRAAEPEVSTYHAYAGRLLAEHGLRLPVEPSATLLSETASWQLAHRVVSTWGHDLETTAVPGTITARLRELAGQLAEHLVEPEALLDSRTELDRLIHTLPPGPKQRGGPTKPLLRVLEAQDQRLILLPLLERLAETMQRESALDFGSQMSLAARLAREHPEVGAAERQRFRAVLLDEYQDTGHAQRVLLTSLFGGGRDPELALTAVGDPIQSIYGWRGASAANLPRFATDFPRNRAGSPAPRSELLTSWRNPAEALYLANGISAELRATGVPVSELRARPGAPAGDVRAALLPDVATELGWVAGHVARTYREARAAGEPVPTAAVLVRRRADMAGVADALRAEGLPVEVVGVGGLLDTPEVRDVVSVLRLLADPLAGSAAVRVLTGARWRIGAADLLTLWRRATELAVRGGGPAEEGPSTLTHVLESAMPVEDAEVAGLVDALADPGPAHRYSTHGYARVAALGDELAALRERLSQPLPELVADVERVLAVDIEVGVHGAGGRANLDAFADVVTGYASNTPTATIEGLLSYLAAAEDAEDGLTPGEVEVDPDRVQVLTVHAAKGLEWQVVAVPHLSDKVFPTTKRSSSWLLNPTELPSHLRGDAAEEDGGEGVPVLDLSRCFDRKELEDTFAAHEKAVDARRLQEERRLLYVALTRTEHTLLVSGHQWGNTGKDPRGPSEFLTALHDLVAEVGTVEHWAPAPEEDAENPVLSQVRSAVWPADPLGARRGAVQAGAARVLDALAAQPVAEQQASAAPAGDDPDGTTERDDPDGWIADVDALLAERNRRQATVSDVALPTQLSVSQLVELAADPDALAQRLRRPLPFPPNPLARRGTAFHAWVERRYGATRLLDMEDLPGSADADAVPEADLQQLQDAFLASSWAQRRPVEVEVPFETVLAGTVLRGRIDAVFADADGGFTVVDWKTGAVPEPARRHALQVQLAAYRVAWAELADVPLERVRAAFHYVRHDETLAPTDLMDADDLAHLLAGS